MDELKNILNSMKSSKLSNYIVAGLDSYLLTSGKVRLFECSRNHQDSVTPHSHRFDFSCLVISGAVCNRVWKECNEDDGDFFQSSIITYSGDVGSHSVKPEGRDFWSYSDSKYKAGDIYSMTSDQVHSIFFSKGATVLFFEGPDKSNDSIIIEPVVNGQVIRTYEKKDYMFLKALEDK